MVTDLVFISVICVFCHISIKLTRPGLIGVPDIKRTSHIFKVGD